MNQKLNFRLQRLKLNHTKLKFGDLDDLCDATESAITEGGGFVG